jgi:hypothetical protein
MFRYAGEYASRKRLSDGAMFWPNNILTAMLKAYVLGDGCIDFLDRCGVSSVSECLISQMQLIAARCGLWSRRQVIYGGKSVEFGHADFQDPVPSSSDGFLPRHELHFSPNNDSILSSNVAQKKHRDIWRVHDNYMLYRVRSVGRSSYSGPVYNMTVEEDNSYLVEGIAVHNCGKMHKNAQGIWVGDPDSCKFIEASWVERPAFVGAVLNHYVSELPKMANILNFNNARLADCMDDIFKLRVADVTGMTVLRVARAEYLRRQREAMIGRVAKSLYWAK